MFIAFNILIISLVLLIAYWWANQGLFSAILHLVCVIIAGAIALAVWEPIVVGLLLRGTGFDDYAWGVTLIMTFVILLVILRVIADKLAPGNVDLPHWANLTFGFPVGLASAILTIGMFIIGAGFLQSTNQIMDFHGMSRVSRGKIEQANSLWVPAHVWTGEFYSYLSAGSLYPTFNDTPLRQYNPDLHFQAASLLRDSAMKGRAKFSLLPSAAEIQEFLFDSTNRRYLIKVKFNTKARDSGEQLTLSSSQIRLIGYATELDKPIVAHPDQWTQYDGFHQFDDVSHYITSEPGQSEASIVIEFPGADFGARHPRFLQIRNTRYRLPAPQEADGGLIRHTVGASGSETVDTSAKDIQSAIQLSNDIRPISVSKNQLPPGVSVTDDLFIDGGTGDFQTGDRAISRALAIKGIFEPAGTRIVQVNVSRESAANLFGAVQDRAGPDAKIALIDARGRAYYPIGYMHQQPGGRTRIKVDIGNFLATMNDIPALPTAGGQPLKLLFAVTIGSNIVGLKLGDVTVGTCSLQIDPPMIRGAPPRGPTAGSGAEE